MDIEGINQKTEILSGAASKRGNRIPDFVVDVLTSKQPETNATKQSACSSPITSHPDPTRFGDWEHAGRCIDF